MRAVHRLCIIIYTKAFALQLRKNHGKTSTGVAEKCLTKQCWTRFVWSTWWPFYGWPWLACWPSPTLTCASGDVSQPSVRYLPSCLTKGLPHQPTLSRNSRIGIWCGRQRMGLPSPRESTCYWCATTHWSTLSYYLWGSPAHCSVNGATHQLWWPILIGNLSHTASKFCPSQSSQSSNGEDKSGPNRTAKSLTLTQHILATDLLRCKSIQELWRETAHRRGFPRCSQGISHRVGSPQAHCLQLSCLPGENHIILPARLDVRSIITSGYFLPTWLVWCRGD